MATSSIQAELDEGYPTCIDYTRVDLPRVKALPIPNPPSYLTNFNSRAIGEDGERGMVHVLKYRDCDIDVYNYEGRKFFSYPKKDSIDRFRPRGICIRSNIVYVTNLMGNQLLLFTTDGYFITIYKDRILEGELCPLKRPRGLDLDENNNIYVCTTNKLVVMNSVLPVYQSYAIDTARPKDVHLFKREIFVLSWQASGVSINILSLACEMIRTFFLSEFQSGMKPWYFDIDYFGHLVIPNQKLNGICVYSSDGKIVLIQPLKLVTKPRGIKLLDHKMSIGLSSNSPYGFCIF